MRAVLIAAALMAASGAAEAAIPAFNATCGKKTEVSAAAGGPIKIGGKDAKLTVEKDDYYEAKRGKMTVALTIGANGKLTLAYTRKKKDNEQKGACTIKA
jgi:hypothetical protein